MSATAKPRPRSRFHSTIIPALAAGLAALILACGCAEEKGPTASGRDAADCVGCHTSENLLRATAEPDSANPPGGFGDACGEIAPPLEVWEKVLVDPAFVQSAPHGGICIGCHGGRAGQLSKAEAHQGLIGDPSAGAGAPACADCHGEIVETHSKSLHFTQNGFRTALERRGASPIANVSAMLDARCASCHTSCGQCHVNRPDWLGGGLVQGHQFMRRPLQTENCLGCHGDRVGCEFLGRNFNEESPIPPDVHHERGMECLDCHIGHTLHGDGTTPESRRDVTHAPQCIDCHQEVESGDNVWHARHARTSSSTQLACQVCHAQPYRNCYGCHVGLDDQELLLGSQIDFRIGRNEDPDSRRPWDFEVKRHVPVLPGSFEDWGVTLSTYAGVPTWLYATPHNIVERTPLAYPPTYDPESPFTCIDGCHGVSDYFLTQSYIDQLVQEGWMAPEEAEANRAVVSGP